MGYKTCHALNSSLDATVCAKDCDRLKKHYFAQECKAKGGLYKCCIRRDKAFCHECRYLIWIKRENNFQHHLQRFCCTLSLCTYPSSRKEPNGTSVFDEKVGCYDLRTSSRVTSSRKTSSRGTSSWVRHPAESHPAKSDIQLSFFYNPKFVFRPKFYYFCAQILYLGSYLCAQVLYLGPNFSICLHSILSFVPKF